MSHAHRFLALAITAATLACSKDPASPAPVPFTVEYRIIPLSNAITKITYRDAGNSTVQTTNLADFPSGTKSFQMTSRPFAATLAVDVNNTTGAPVSFILSISIDGEVRATVPGLAPNNSTYSRSVEYTVP